MKFKIVDFISKTGIYFDIALLDSITKVHAYDGEINTLSDFEKVTKGTDVVLVTKDNDVNNVKLIGINEVHCMGKVVVLHTDSSKFVLEALDGIKS